MKGDQIEINEANYQVAQQLIHILENKISSSKTPYLISIGGESGTGKTTTAYAVAELLNRSNINTIILSLDDYFNLPPQSNDKKRREDPTWLGPHKEINFITLNKNIHDILKGEEEIIKPHVDYHNNTIQNVSLNLKGIKVIVLEGTYVSLIKNVHCKVFILGGPEETLENRLKRNRGLEMNDAFIENILQTEHKIIAGHQFLADFIIDLDYKLLEI